MLTEGNPYGGRYIWIFHGRRVVAENSYSLRRGSPASSAIDLSEHPPIAELCLKISSFIFLTFVSCASIIFCGITDQGVLSICALTSAGANVASARRFTYSLYFPALAYSNMLLKW